MVSVCPSRASRANKSQVMPISVTCECGQCFRVREELAGRSAHCPECDERVPVPATNPEFYRDEPPAAYGLQEQVEEETLQTVARKRAKRLRAAAKRVPDVQDSPWVRLIRKLGLRPWWGNQYRIKIAAGEMCVVTAEGLRNLLIKGELTPENEVAWYDPTKPLADPDWRTIEEGPGKTEFCLKVFFDPLGAYVREGAQRGAIYGSIALWILFIALTFVGISAESGVRGGMVFLGVMCFIALIVAAEAWLLLNSDPMLVLLVIIFIGLWPLGILISVAFVQISFMVFSGAIGALIRLIIGTICKESTPELPDTSHRRR